MTRARLPDAGKDHGTAWRFGRWLACSIGLLAAGPALAGPPYVTDDPEPTRTGGWENYVYASGTTVSGNTGGQAGLELNYGAAPGLQVTLNLPVGYASSEGLRGGTGDLGAAAKYRFLHAGDGGWLPDAAVFPAITLPTAGNGLGTGHATLFLPLWLEKDRGRWSTFAGGGYVLNPGGGQRNHAVAGWAVTRSVGERLNLGVEVYHQTRTAADGAAVTNLGLGVVYQATRHWALMASGGPGLERPARAGTSAFYLSLQFTN